MVKPTTLQKKKKKTKGPRYQERKNKHRKFVKKLVMEKRLSNMSHQKPNEIRVNWKVYKGKHVGDTQGQKDSHKKFGNYKDA